MRSWFRTLPTAPKARRAITCRVWPEIWVSRCPLRNFGVNRLTAIGEQRIQIGGGLRHWVETPRNGPEGWSARIALTLLFPT